MARSAGGAAGDRASRALHWPACQNTRDLGGIPARGGVTRSGAVIRSDNLAHLTAEGREAMHAYGVTTVIDLRSAGELARSPSPFAAGVGATYVHRELIDDSNMNEIGDAASMLERYLYIVNSRPGAFRGVFEAIAYAEGCVLFHCFAGKDRTGLIAAMMLELAGVTPEDIAADYGETDLQLASQYELWIAEAGPEKRAAYAEELRCPPERILGVLEHVDRRWGGVASYLEAAGLPPAAIDRLASKLG
ncbi:MAG TPA: tyrosine-protein phosphatase [Candidatus Dormibacteraeota bacterium]